MKWEERERGEEENSLMRWDKIVEEGVLRREYKMLCKIWISIRWIV